MHFLKLENLNDLEQTTSMDHYVGIPQELIPLQASTTLATQEISTPFVKVICEFCGKLYSNYSYHIRFECLRSKRIESTRNKSFCCNVCGKSYVHQRNLSRHIQYECSGKRKFICNFCQKAFIQKIHLHSHVNRMHSKP